MDGWMDARKGRIMGLKESYEVPCGARSVKSLMAEVDSGACTGNDTVGKCCMCTPL